MEATPQHTTPDTPWNRETVRAELDALCVAHEVGTFRTRYAMTAEQLFALADDAGILTASNRALVRSVLRPRATPHERCKRIVARIAEVTGETWTFGYIGNCDHARDDRAWYAFRRTGEVGTSADRIGGVSTSELDSLAGTLAGALKMASMLKS